MTVSIGQSGGRSVGRAVARVRVSLAAMLAVVPALLMPLAATGETLREAMAAAYTSNPRLDAERARLRATDEEVPRAKSGYRPQINGSVELSRTRVDSVPATTSSGSARPRGYEVNVRQPIFNGFQTTNAVREAEAGVRVGRENLRLVETQTLLEAATAYMDVVRDLAIARLRENNVAVLTRELRAAEIRRDAREVTVTDVAQAQARRARAISGQDLAKANLNVSRAVYERVVGSPPGRLTEPPLANKYLPSNLQEALAIAEKESPNVGSALYREQAARHAVDKVWGELLPRVDVEASYAHVDEPSSTIDETSSAQVTGRLTLPLYQGGEVHARVRQAKHTHVSRLQEVEQARTETQANVTAAWARLVAARAQMKSDQVQVSAARSALDGVRQEELVGQRTVIEVLNAQQEYLDAQVQLTVTRRDVIVAGYSLLTAMGRLTADVLGLTTQVYDPEEHYQETRRKWLGVSITHADGRLEQVEVAEEAESIKD